MATALLGCKREKGPPVDDGDPPVPSVTIANIIGTCTDVAVCERECDAGSGDRCRRLGSTYQFGGKVPRDEALATEYFVRACDLKNAFGCVSAGQSYEFHHGVEKDDARAYGFYRRACDIGYAAGCVNQAILLEAGRGVAKDEAGAGELYERACKAGASMACGKMKERDGG